jgi:hypothetical protein
MPARSSRQDPAVQDRPGGRRRRGRGLAWIDRLPGRRGPRLACRWRHHRGPVFRRVNKCGQLRARSVALIARPMPQVARSRRIFPPQPALRHSHLGGRARGFALQDDGRDPPQVGRRPARLRARRRFSAITQERDRFHRGPLRDRAPSSGCSLSRTAISPSAPFRKPSTLAGLGRDKKEPWQRQGSGPADLIENVRTCSSDQRGQCCR